MLFSLENAKNAKRLSHYDCHILHTVHSNDICLSLKLEQSIHAYTHTHTHTSLPPADVPPHWFRKYSLHAWA